MLAGKGLNFWYKNWEKTNAKTKAPSMNCLRPFNRVSLDIWDTLCVYKRDVDVEYIKEMLTIS